MGEGFEPAPAPPFERVPSMQRTGAGSSPQRFLQHVQALRSAGGAETDADVPLSAGKVGAWSQYQAVVTEEAVAQDARRLGPEPAREGDDPAARWHPGEEVGVARDEGHQRCHILVRQGEI